MIKEKEKEIINNWEKKQEFINAPSILYNPRIKTGHIGFEIRIKDCSVLRAKGWKWFYYINFYIVRKRKFLYFWPYKKMTRFDSFQYKKDKIDNKIKPMRFITKKYDDLQRFIHDLYLDENDRVFDDEDTNYDYL